VQSFAGLYTVYDSVDNYGWDEQRRQFRDELLEYCEALLYNDCSFIGWN